MVKKHKKKKKGKKGEGIGRRPSSSDNGNCGNGSVEENGEFYTGYKQVLQKLLQEVSIEDDEVCADRFELKMLTEGLVSDKEQVVIDTMSEISAMPLDPKFCAIRVELVSKQGFDVILRFMRRFLDIPEGTPYSEVKQELGVICQAVNCLGSLAMEPKVADLISLHPSTTIAISQNLNAALTNPQVAFVEVLRRMIASDYFYAQADAAFCLGFFLHIKGVREGLNKADIFCLLLQVLNKQFSLLLRNAKLDSESVYSVRAENICLFSLLCFHRLLSFDSDSPGSKLDIPEVLNILVTFLTALASQLHLFFRFHEIALVALQCFSRLVLHKDGMCCSWARICEPNSSTASAIPSATSSSISTSSSSSSEVKMDMCNSCLSLCSRTQDLFGFLRSVMSTYLEEVNSDRIQQQYSQAGTQSRPSQQQSAFLQELHRILNSVCLT